MSKKNSHLFKERITKTHYDALVKELSDAIGGGEAALMKLLLGTETPDLYENHGSYQDGQHDRCIGLKEKTYTEKRLCKCMYYRNSAHPTACDKCDFQDRFYVVGDYDISDYEVPAHYYGDGIGEIDLVITDGEAYYATEVKPYKNNSETLLRMVAEILTYTLGYPEGKYKKAIGFFEQNYDDKTPTAQQNEYNKIAPALMDIIKKADITVFRFEEVGHKQYRICKL